MPEEILKNIYRIPVVLPENPLKTLNSYLIREDGRSLLIDTGFRRSACRKALSEGLKDLGIKQEELDILITHLHSDHVGLAPEFVGKDRKIFMSGQDLSYMKVLSKEGRAGRINEKYLKAGFPYDELKAFFLSNPVHIYAPDMDCPNFSSINGGEVLKIAGYKLMAILTPGHSPGHMCFWMEEQKIMFTGDHILFDITPNITAWPDTKDSLGDYLESLKMLYAYDVKKALPAHRAAGNFHARIEEPLRHHAKRVNEAYEAICHSPGLTAYEIAGHMTWNIKSDTWDSFPKVQKWFAVGECISHLDYLHTRGIIKTKLLDEFYHYYPLDKSQLQQSVTDTITENIINIKYREKID